MPHIGWYTVTRCCTGLHETRLKQKRHVGAGVLMAVQKVAVSAEGRLQDKRQRELHLPVPRVWNSRVPSAAAETMRSSAGDSARQVTASSWPCSTWRGVCASCSDAPGGPARLRRPLRAMSMMSQMMSVVSLLPARCMHAHISTVQCDDAPRPSHLDVSVAGKERQPS